jgi:PilZ domain
MLWTEVGSSDAPLARFDVPLVVPAVLGRWSSHLGAILLDVMPAYQRMASSMMTNQLTGNGRRWGQRIELDIPVEVAAHASPTIRGRLKNLSLSGALIEADHELRLHAHIEVSIKLPETGCSARVMARVTREVEGAIGVEWCEFAPSTVKDLLRSPSIRLPL